MRLKSLRIQNFRSFADASFVFPANGTVLIRGRDLSTGESSGTGKSAIFLAIAHALDILPTGLSAKALQNWNSDKDLQVELRLDIDGVEYVLMRGKKTCILSGETVVVSNAGSYSEGVRKLLHGVPPMVFRSLTYRPQRENGFFLSMGPSEKIEFLSEVLGLIAIEQAIEKAEKAAKQLEIQVQEARVGVETYTNAITVLGIPPEAPNVDLPALQNALEVVQKTKADAEKAEDAARQEMENSVADQRKQLDIRIGELGAARAKACEFENQLLAADERKRAEVATHNEKVATEVSRLTRAIDKIKSQRTEIQALESQLAALQASECPTCHRSWDDSAQTAVEVAQKLALLQRDARTLPGLNDEIANLLQSKRPAVIPDPKIAVCREIAEKLSGDMLQVSMAKLQYPAELEQAYQKARKAREEAGLQVLPCKLQIADAEARLRSHQTLLETHKTKLADLNRHLTEWRVKLTSALTALNAEKDFVAAMGRTGFLGRIVSDVLYEIAQEANQWLGRMANINRTSLSFTTETEKGKQKIQTWVDVRGNRVRPETSLSGGQMTSLEQAIDLAVMSVISRRRGGVIPQWLCLDEVFNGLGQVTKESALEILREIGKTKLVMVIDHGSEFKEAFDQTIDIVFENGVSKAT